jgi:hypothetical protein
MEVCTSDVSTHSRLMWADSVGEMRELLVYVCLQIDNLSAFALS